MIWFIGFFVFIISLNTIDRFFYLLSKKCLRCTELVDRYLNHHFYKQYSVIRSLLKSKSSNLPKGMRDIRKGQLFLLCLAVFAVAFNGLFPSIIHCGLIVLIALLGSLLMLICIKRYQVANSDDNSEESILDMVTSFLKIVALFLIVLITASVSEALVVLFLFLLLAILAFNCVDRFDASVFPILI